MVATDSYRLSVKETTLDKAVDGVARGERSGPNACRSLARIATAAGPEDDRRHAAREPGHLHLGRVVLSSRLVEGRFPNYRQLLPESYEHELNVNAAELLDVVRRVGLLAQKNAPLRLRLHGRRPGRLGSDA